MERVQLASPAQRLLFIDLFRGLIALVMLEGHVTNSTILMSLRSTKQFHYLNLFNGMIAPSFIFLAGFAMGLVLDRKWDSFVRLQKPVWLQIRRLLFVLGLAYWLHLPAWSFRSLLKLNRDTIYYFLRCDVLHVIALSLLFILVLAMFVRNRRLLCPILLILGGVSVLITPFLHAMELRDYLPDLIADYLNPRHGALFPIFPWCSYALLGTAFCMIFLDARRRDGVERKFFLTLAVAGAIMLPGAFALFYVPWQYYVYADPAQSSPRHFLMKMGFVFLVLSLWWFYEQKKKPTGSFLSIVGQETLMVYGLHLILVYGASFTSHYIARDVGPSLTFLPSFAISFLLMLSMTLSALAWHWLKKNRPRAAKYFFYALCAAYFVPFFLS